MRHATPTSLGVLLVCTALLSLPVAALANATNPHGELKWECAQCHTAESWSKLQSPLKFDHAATRYPLTAAHRGVACRSCHTSLAFKDASEDCAGCHVDPHANAVGNDCGACHVPVDWQNRETVFQDHAERGFALTGVHAVAECEACHTLPLAEALDQVESDCIACHLSQWSATDNPDHQEAGFTEDCSLCHLPSSYSWQGAHYAHSPPLTLIGAHDGAACNACHVSIYAGTQSECVFCHENDFVDAEDPDHEAAEFERDCQLCHSEFAWEPTHLDHSLTGYPLTGKHVDVACADCHVESYTATASDCLSCHATDRGEAHDPDHLAAGFSDDCQTCHTTEGWNPADLDHDLTGFSLTGAHLETDCQSCHANGYSGTSSDCYACHETAYTDAADPDHEGGAFDHNCTNCHTTAAWSPADYDHALADFALTGAHTSATCVDCHATQYTGTPSECIACHEADFLAAKDPDHDAGGFDPNCTLCHSTEAWEPALFDHQLSGFPLDGAHAQAACNSCHASGYSGTSTLCFDCHGDNYAGVSDPVHVPERFSHDCAACHSTTEWAGASFDHDLAQFALDGAHTTTDCSSCHASGYTGTTTDCYTCHLSAYTGVTDPDHAGGNYDHDCTQCHTTTGWEPADWDHNLADFQLTGAHTETSCESCHQAGYTGTPIICVACHESDYLQAVDPNHPGAGFPITCEVCHETAGWIPSHINHDLTGFPLTGAHAAPACEACHTNGYTGTSAQCFACHESDYNSAGDPNHVAGNFSTDCAICHTNVAWEPADFDHARSGFVLDGAHASVACNQCHQKGYTGTPSDCYSCHATDFTSVVDPNHIDAGFPHDCRQCHSTGGWIPAAINHNLTGFPLTGAHKQASCTSCHPSGYSGTPSDCFACHESDYLAANDPDHPAGNFDHDCSGCHTTVAWEPAGINHDQTAFPLTGAHRDATCQSCHTSGFTGTPTDCFSCHESDYTNAGDPDHPGGGFDHNCSVCHSTAAWEPADFNHDLSAFALTGAHTSVSCQACHSTGYTGTASECFACHEDDYLGTNDPNHAARNYDHDCTNCHTTASWDAEEFDHDVAAFSLTGAHQSADCAACHVAGYVGTSSECFTCHETQYLQAADPNHPAGNFNHDCSGCHATAAWTPADFDHSLSGFPLDGAHLSTACSQCHTSGYTGTPGDCYSCHQSAYTGTADPNHIEAGFPHACAQCHTTTAWQPGELNHDLTGFPLTGAHTSVNCATCHVSGYTGTSRECVACHESDYLGTGDPNHVTSGFPQTCGVCHSTMAWEPADFNHDLAAFALTGAHRGAACESCHASGYTGTPSDCYACHVSEFAGVVDPDHAGGGYDHDCTNCHTTAAWLPADWDHDAGGFPLVGAHQDVGCNACHATGYTGTPIACLACHEHNFVDAQEPNHVLGAFGGVCTDCHSMDGWAPALWTHEETGFILTGAHDAIVCSGCHSTGFAGTPTTCFGCHESDFVGAIDPDHISANFPNTCETCHSTTAWVPSSLDHDLTSFPLTGAHVGTACASCHVSGYTGTPSDCYNCHAADYASSSEVRHAEAGLSTNCTDCHTTTAWLPADYEHDQAGFTLTGAHNAASCNSCHADGYAGTPTTCIACHQTDYDQVLDPNHVVSGFDHNCASCHGTIAWRPADFDHEQTVFPLTGGHAGVGCLDCHASGYTGTPTDCWSCHQSDFTSVADPSHVASGFEHSCTSCHNISEWRPATFDHNRTVFPLTGGHSGVGCLNCHASGYTGTPSDCWSCHQSDFTGVVDPNHVTSGFDHNCTSCHETSGWRPATFDHNQTAFPLTGGHSGVGCLNCHASGYTGTPTDCWSCHQSDFTGVVDPNHVTSGFDHNCTVCHATNAWLPATFDHNGSQFPLTGAHSTVSCNSCHASGYTGTPIDCIACHQTDYDQALDPNHAASGFDQNCTVCHSTVTWRPATFDHNQTTFPLTGGHSGVGCLNCHASGYTGTPTDCWSCHQSDFTGVVDPNHVASGFDHKCTSCHSTNAWLPASFDHNQSQFPLTGAHTAAPCGSCHTTGYTGTPTDCWSCHESDFTGALDPNHVASGFDHNCTTCHATSAWTPTTFDHNQTAFPLTGGHSGVGCLNCHASGYTGTPTDCWSCHQSDFTGVIDPNHVASNFDHNCTTCHSMSAWIPSTFDHSQTAFPLTGGHSGVGCLNCHASGYTGTPTDCWSCHQSDFTGVVDPNHVASNFDHNCTTCHSTSAWIPTTFDHNQTAFPLTGGHSGVGCLNCHASGYTGTPSDCWSCHQSDFTDVVVPNHVAGGYSHDCTICHSTNVWVPSTFDHEQSQFPLTGAHLAVACTNCHASGYSGTPTDCWSCHASAFNGVGDPNHVAGGYSHDCTICHTTSAWIPAAIDHDQTQFPLTGAHLSVACNACHTSGYSGTPTICIACHESDYAATSNPNHQAAGFPSACEGCHTTSGWTPANWDHDGQYFPIYSGSHNGRWNDCADCHVTPSNFSAFECILCHKHDKSSTDADHSSVRNYQYLSAACYDCHPTGRH